MLHFILILVTAISSSLHREESWSPIEVFEFLYRKQPNLKIYDPSSHLNNDQLHRVKRLFTHHPTVKTNIFILNKIDYDEDGISTLDEYTSEFLEQLYAMVNMKFKKNSGMLFILYSLDEHTTNYIYSSDVDDKDAVFIHNKLSSILGYPFLKHKITESFLQDNSNWIFYLLIFLVVSGLAYVIVKAIKEEKQLENGIVAQDIQNRSYEYSGVMLNLP